MSHAMKCQLIYRAVTDQIMELIPIFPLVDFLNINWYFMYGITASQVCIYYTVYCITHEETNSSQIFYYRLLIVNNNSNKGLLFQITVIVNNFFKQDQTLLNLSFHHEIRWYSKYKYAKFWVG